MLRVGVGDVLVVVLGGVGSFFGVAVGAVVVGCGVGVFGDVVGTGDGCLVSIVGVALLLLVTGVGGIGTPREVEVGEAIAPIVGKIGGIVILGKGVRVAVLTG